MSQTARANSTGIAWPMTVLTMLFFMWGFMTVMNDVLVPYWKKEFVLSYAESLSVQWCFFGAYFLGSLVYWILSTLGHDPINRIGYKRGAMFGLVVAAVGCAMFVAASWSHMYWAFLSALFVLGLGFTLLQIAANPFVAIIGDPDRASSRLNLAQAFNSLGTTLAPLIGGWLLFDHIGNTTALGRPYFVYACVFIILALILWITRLPEPPTLPSARGHRAWRHPQLRFGMLAIFCYVGAEVAIGSLFINFLHLPEVFGMAESQAKYYLSLYWGGAMCGRFLGALAMSGKYEASGRALIIGVLALALFGLLWCIQSISGGLDFAHLWPMLILILVNAIAFLWLGRSSSLSLGAFAVIAASLCAAVLVLPPAWALWAMVAIGLFNSVMWGNIFTLAIDGLGADTSQGSSMLVMMIVGGAMIPKLQGLMADSVLGLSYSYILPLICYAYLAWYGFISSSYSSAFTFDPITGQYERK